MIHWIYGINIVWIDAFFRQAQEGYVYLEVVWHTNQILRNIKIELWEYIQNTLKRILVLTNY